VSQIDRTREHLIETYRKKAKHYDITSRFYPVPGYPQRAQRLRAVQALGLRRGDSVVDVACGTGLSFALIEQVIGPDGRIVGVDLTDAMLAQAQHRIDTSGWNNVSLVHADAVDVDGVFYRTVRYETRGDPNRPKSSPSRWISVPWIVARTVVRRAERSAWAAYEVHGETMNKLPILYLNRLSDLVFILARYANREQGDVLWVPGGERG